MDNLLMQKKLREPFPPDQVGWKPQVISGNRGLAVAYIDARAVMQRLDDVVGTLGWSDKYVLLPEGSVECHLALWDGTRWISKVDVGSQSEQPDEGDRLKAAYSDALKRAAVKFGVGRYLYDLPLQWLPYDSQKKQFLEQPRLPAWAIPSAAPRPNDDTVLEWGKFLEDPDTGCQKLNERLAELSQMDPATKKVVWGMVTDVAKKFGLSWDGKSKTFHVIPTNEVAV